MEEIMIFLRKYPCQILKITKVILIREYNWKRYIGNWNKLFILDILLFQIDDWLEDGGRIFLNILGKLKRPLTNLGHTVVQILSNLKYTRLKVSIYYDISQGF